MKLPPLLKIVLFLFFPFVAYSQPAIDWSTNFGDTQAEYATDLIATSNNTFTILFNRLSSNGESEFCLTKVEENNTEIWTKCFSGVFTDLGKGLIATEDGGMVICGKSNSPDFLGQKYNGGTDGFLMKLNSSGILEWQIGLGGGQLDVLNDIGLSPNGDLIAVGYSFSNDGDLDSNEGLADVWVISVSPNGQLNWSKRYGGISSDQGTALAFDGNHMVVAGHSNTGNEFRKGGDDWYVLKLDVQGNQLWEKTYGGDKHEKATDILKLSDGSYAIVGFTESFGGDVSNNNGKRDGWLVKLSADGNIQWTQVIGGSQNEQLSSVAQNFEDQIIVSGFGDSADGDLSNAKGRSDSFLAAFDLQGNREWMQNYGGQKNDQVQTLIEGTGGSLLMAGYTNSTNGDLNNNLGEEDAWVLKLKGTNQLVVSLDGDQTICEGDTVHLNPNVINCNSCTYSWSDGSTATSRMLTPSQSTSFVLTVSNGDGQQSMDSVFVTVNPLPNVTATLENISCFGLNDGSVSLSQNDNYQYLWDNGSVSSDIANLEPGSIGVTINTMDGCQVKETYEIIEPEEFFISLSANDTICFGAQINISISANGGVGNYSYSWNNGVQTSSNNNVGAGDYSVTVIDGNGCSKITETSIVSYDSLQLVSIITQPLCVDSMKGSIELELLGGTSDYSYKWADGSTLNTLFDLGADTYLVTATDGSCGEISQSFLLESAASLEINMEETFVGNDLDSSGIGKILLTVEGGVAPYTYSWDSGETADSLVNLMEGTFVVTISDASGCQLISSFTLGNTTSLNNIEALQSFELFPNPSSGTFSVEIKLNKVQDLQILLFNAVGHLLQSHWYSSQMLNDFFDLSHLPKGLYFMQVKSADGIVTRKILIQ